MLCCSSLHHSLQRYGLQFDKLLCPWDSPGNSAGVGCHFLLQGIFPTQELNPGLLHCRQILYQLNYEGRPELWITFCFALILHVVFSSS